MSKTNRLTSLEEFLLTLSNPLRLVQLMGHASIVTTTRYIHATDRGKRGAIVVLSEYRQKHGQKDGHK